MAIIISGITRLSRLPPQQGERMEKVFIADDKFVDVISILERRGWTRSRHANSPNFLLKWRNLSNINFRMLRKDQFVNHVFNSQQLSNKALLADHLAFHHDRRRKQRLDGSGTEPCAVPSYLAHGCERTKGQNKLEWATDVGSTMNPEAYFPRCFNMQDGALSVLVEAFIVSAAAALLRRIVQGKDVPHQDADPGNTNRLDVPTAAISVISRYITYKDQYDSSSQDTPGQSSARRTWTTASAQSLTPWDDPLQHGSVQRTHGVGHSPIVPLSIEDPACSIVLAAWEAVAAEAPTAEGTKAMDKHFTRGNAEGNRDTEECFYFPRALGDSSLEEAFLSRETSAREVRTLSSLTGSHGAASKLTVDDNSCDGRALRCLQALEAADPQAAVMEEANAWIVKPAGLSCGRGVHATSSLRGLLTACRQLGWKAVVQKYVERPLLVQGYKFDLRQWVLVTSCNPLMVWGFGECYVRFASKPFTTNPSSLSDKFVHLCNHSVQRDNESGSGSIDDSTQGLGSRPSGSRGHMWTADQFREHLRDRFEYDAFRDVVLPRIRSVVVETLLTVRESLEMKGKALEWLGFDLILTEHLQVMLLEVNVSPDVSHSTPVTARLVPAATEDALALLLDDGVAAARAAAPLLAVNQHDASQRRMATEDRGSSPKSSIEEPTTDSDAWTGDVDACERETEPRAEGVPRWRLWYRGKEESTTALGSQRDAKRSFFEARRKQRRQEDHRRKVEPRNKCIGGSLSIVDDIVELMAARSKIRQDNHATGTIDYR